MEKIKDFFEGYEKFYPNEEPKAKEEKFFECEDDKSGTAGDDNSNDDITALKNEIEALKSKLNEVTNNDNKAASGDPSDTPKNE